MIIHFRGNAYGIPLTIFSIFSVPNFDIYAGCATTFPPDTFPKMLLKGKVARARTLEGEGNEPSHQAPPNIENGKVVKGCAKESASKSAECLP